MPVQSTNVFVSYSHADASLVAPVVKLLRVNKSFVFQDIDGIQSGKRWRSEIATGLAESHLVVVFWCDHASRSDEVSKEWKAAIEQEKDLLPLLLDATPLPPELDQFQRIDFRGTVGPNHSSIDSWLLIARLTAIFVTLVLLSFLFVWLEKRPQSPPRGRHSSSASYFLLGVSFVMACIIASFLPKWLDLGSKLQSIARSHPGEVERRIASELEAEILRRTALRGDSGA